LKPFYPRKAPSRLALAMKRKANAAKAIRKKGSTANLVLRSRQIRFRKIGISSAKEFCKIDCSVLFNVMLQN